MDAAAGRKCIQGADFFCKVVFPYLHVHNCGMTMQLSRTLFWDTDYDKIDWEKNAPYVVDRVLQRGTLEEFKAILTFYGRERMREIIKNLRYMDKRPMHFASVYFDIPLEEMRCYKLKQLNLSHWDY